jgi:hypothetical protein
VPATNAALKTLRSVLEEKDRWPLEERADSVGAPPAADKGASPAADKGAFHLRSASLEGIKESNED